MNIPADEKTFRAHFSVTNEDARFQYEINRPLVWLLIIFSASVLGGTYILSTRPGFSGSLGLFAWVSSLGISLGLMSVLFVWRTFARRSAILFSEEALIWLDKSTVHHVLWSELNMETFVEALSGARNTRGVLSFKTTDGDKELPIFTPYMRIDYSRFTLGILMRLKEAEENEA
jgi:hypothetical protein